MNNENNSENKEQEKSVYQIPGVIIPKQVTDSGVVLGTESEEDKSKETENKDTSQNIYEMPGVVIPAQKTDGGQVETINNVTEELLPPVEEKIKVDTSTPPILPGMPQVPKVEEKPKKVKQKKERPEGNAKIGCLTIMVIVLVIALLYFVFITYISPPKVTSEGEKNLRKQIFNKNSLIVNELYSLVEASGCNSRNEIFYNDKQVVSVTDLTPADKNYLAYKTLTQNNFEKKNCSNYSNALNKNDKEKKWFCGEDYLYKNTTGAYDDSNDLTYILNDNILKNQVERMFGQGEYQATTFEISPGTRYLYNKNTEIYILQSTEAESTCTTYTNKLSSVTEDDTSITLHVIVTNKTTNNEINYNYHFTKSDNGNYYFEKLTKGD